MKVIRIVFFIIFSSTSFCAQNSDWKPIPIGDSLHTKISYDRAIWKRINKRSSSLFQSSLIYQDRKPVFFNKIKPEGLPKPEFDQIPLTVIDQIPCDGNFLFKDNSIW